MTHESIWAQPKCTRTQFSLHAHTHSLSIPPRTRHFSSRFPFLCDAAEAAPASRRPCPPSPAASAVAGRLPSSATVSSFDSPLRSLLLAHARPRLTLARGLACSPPYTGAAAHSPDTVDLRSLLTSVMPPLAPTPPTREP
jgi:hypothetical protein